MRTSYGTPKVCPDTNHAFFSKLLGIHGLRTEALIATAVGGPTSQCGIDHHFTQAGCNRPSSMFRRLTTRYRAQEIRKAARAATACNETLGREQFVAKRGGIGSAKFTSRFQFRHRHIKIRQGGWLIHSPRLLLSYFGKHYLFLTSLRLVLSSLQPTPIFLGQHPLLV